MAAIERQIAEHFTVVAAKAVQIVNHFAHLDCDGRVRKKSLLRDLL